MEIIIIVGIVLLSVFIVCIVIAKKLSKHIFKCKSCSYEFSPDWKKLIFVTHYEKEYDIKCPRCNGKVCLDETE